MGQALMDCVRIYRDVLCSWIGNYGHFFSFDGRRWKEINKYIFIISMAIQHFKYFRLKRKPFLENFSVALKLYCTLYCNSNFSRNGLVYWLTELIFETNVESEENNYSVKICQRKNYRYWWQYFSIWPIVKFLLLVAKVAATPWWTKQTSLT